VEHLHVEIADRYYTLTLPSSRLNLRSHQIQLRGRYSLNPGENRNIPQAPEVLSHDIGPTSLRRERQWWGAQTPGWRERIVDLRA
jgi:hypothetical protein